MSNFYIDVIMKDPRYRSEEAICDEMLLEPGFRRKNKAMIQKACSMGYDVRQGETYRSPWRQLMLWRQKKTTLRHVGPHGKGCGSDLLLFIDGVYQTDGNKYMFLLDLAKEFEVISGIDWGEPDKHHSFRDFDHIQAIPLSREPELFAGLWYPSPNYNPITNVDPNHATA